MQTKTQEITSYNATCHPPQDSNLLNPQIHSHQSPLKINPTTISQIHQKNIKQIEKEKVKKESREEKEIDRALAMEE